MWSVAVLAAFLCVQLGFDRAHAQALPQPAQNAGPRLSYPGKVGLGTYPMRGERRMMTDLRRLDVPWFYTWRTGPSPTRTAAGRLRRPAPYCTWPSQAPTREPCFVPMVWGARAVAQTKRADRAPRNVPLLTFNEPDDRRQANLSVEKAGALWPALMARGRPLSSPAATTGQTLGENSWLGRFMSEVDRNGYRVDFIAVHYYADTPDIDRFQTFLEQVRAAYGRPVWVTEWALADWKNPRRFTAAQQAAFFKKASAMLDKLDFVERHAWFGAYSGMDGWHLGSAAIAHGRPTPVGFAMRAAVGRPGRR